VCTAVVILASACTTGGADNRDIRDPYLERLRAITNEAIDVMAAIDTPLRRALGSDELMFTGLADVRAPQRLAIVADKAAGLEPSPGFVADHEVIVEAFRRLRDTGRDLDAAIAAEDSGAAVVALVVMRDILRRTAITVTPETCGSVTPGGGYGLCEPAPTDPWDAAVFGAFLPIAARYEVLSAGHEGFLLPLPQIASAIRTLQPAVIDLLQSSRASIAAAEVPAGKQSEHAALLEYLNELIRLETSALASVADPSGVEAFEAIRGVVIETTCAVRSSLSTSTKALSSDWFNDPEGVCGPSA